MPEPIRVVERPGRAEERGWPRLRRLASTGQREGQPGGLGRPHRGGRSGQAMQRQGLDVHRAGLASLDQAIEEDDRVPTGGLVLGRDPEDGVGQVEVGFDLRRRGEVGDQAGIRRVDLAGLRLGGRHRPLRHELADRLEDVGVGNGPEERLLRERARPRVRDQSCRCDPIAEPFQSRGQLGPDPRLVELSPPTMLGEQQGGLDLLEDPRGLAVDPGLPSGIALAPAVDEPLGVGRNFLRVRERRRAG